MLSDYTPIPTCVHPAPLTLMELFILSPHDLLGLPCFLSSTNHSIIALGNQSPILLTVQTRPVDIFAWPSTIFSCNWICCLCCCW